MKPILAFILAVFATANDRGHDRHINPNCDDFGSMICIEVLQE